MAAVDGVPRRAPRGGWTGGQYSLARLALAVGVATTLARLAVDAAPGCGGALAPEGLPVGWCSSGWTVFVGATLGGLATVLLALGSFDRWAAIAAWLSLVALATRQPEPPDVLGLVLLGLLLALHMLAPTAPFGSLAARGRLDPAGGWTLPPALAALPWAGLLLASLWPLLGGWETLVGPADASDWERGGALLALALLPLAFYRRARLAVWGMLAGVQLAGLLLGSPFTSWTVLLLLLLACEPAWVAGEGGPAHLFYDGSCGLCHRGVRFQLAEAPGDRELRFAPLGGTAFQRLVPKAKHSVLPDSMVLLTEGGDLLTRSAAALALGRRLGGLWGVLARVGSLLPVRALDAAYDGVARIRKRVFAAPKDVCPLLPPELRQRFDA